MATVTVLTIIPKEVAVALSEKRRIENFNNLPQLRREVLEVLRDYVSEQTGYNSVPLAGLCQSHDSNGKVLIKSDFTDFLPVNRKDSVLLILDIPEDQIITIDYSTLLNISESFTNASGDTDDIEYLKDSLRDALEEASGDHDFTAPNTISFIPFLDYSKCKYFAVFNAQLEADSSFNIPGIDKIPMQELTTFTN